VILRASAPLDPLPGQTLEEAKFINMSLTTLGKCINSLVDQSQQGHIPYRESKLTRLLKDSFGGSARTSLVVCVGPSVNYHSETTNTIKFGQRAIKIENSLRRRELVDYKALCRMQVRASSLRLFLFGRELGLGSHGSAPS